MGDMLLCTEESTLSPCWGVSRRLEGVFSPPALLPQQFGVRQVPPVPMEPSAPFCELTLPHHPHHPSTPRAGDAQPCTFNLANVHIEARTKPIGSSLIKKK